MRPTDNAEQLIRELDEVRVSSSVRFRIESALRERDKLRRTVGQRPSGAPRGWKYVLTPVRPDCLACENAVCDDCQPQRPID